MQCFQGLETDVIRLVNTSTFLTPQISHSTVCYIVSRKAVAGKQNHSKISEATHSRKSETSIAKNPCKTIGTFDR